MTRPTTQVTRGRKATISRLSSLAAPQPRTLRRRRVLLPPLVLKLDWKEFVKLINEAFDRLEITPVTDPRARLRAGAIVGEPATLPRTVVPWGV